MIVPMKKVSIVMLNSERKSALKKLRKMGLVHLETVEGKGPVLQAYKDASAAADKAISVLDEIKMPKKSLPVQVELSTNEADEKAREIVALSDRKKSLLDLISQNTQEIDRLAKWGSVDPEDFKSLAEKGICMYMYEIPSEKYGLIGETSKTMVVNSVAKITRFLLLSEEEVLDRPADLPPEAFAVPMPDKSTGEFYAEIEASRKELSSIEKSLTDAKKYRSAIGELKKTLTENIEFETIFSGMERDKAENAADEKSAGQETIEEALAKEADEMEDHSGKLAWLTGYVPVDSMEDFTSTCKMNEWAFSASDPADDDPVPTKLHNNKLVSIIYPLTDFLDVTPGYHEFDISGWFLLFFCIFFAMIFGDAGYGSIIALLGLLLLAKSKQGKRSLPVLVTILGLATMLYGVFTCTWFGIDYNVLPEWMVGLSLKPISQAKLDVVYGMGTNEAKEIANTNQKIFCFMLALVQLSIAHIKCFIADRKSLKCLGDLGSLLQLWGMFYVVMSLVVNAERFPLSDTGNPIPIFGGAITLPSIMPLIAIGVLLFGFILSFIFSNYEGSVGKSVLESCKNIISVLLGVVNVFSDIVSYIRLWAVALAGAAISGTVNSMALNIFGANGGVVVKMVIFGILMVVLLGFGHGLNVILNVLSVVVHGVRLNTLEFSQHLGMAWSGTKYRPFSEEGSTNKEFRVEGLGKAINAMGSLSKLK